MQTVYTTRKQRLEELLHEHGSIAELNEALGWPRTDARLSRIRNENSRKDRGDKVFRMGDAIAREIEKSLNLPEGWMDTPAMPDPNTPVAKAVELLNAMEPEKQYQAVRLLDALVEPKMKTGT